MDITLVINSIILLLSAIITTIIIPLIKNNISSKKFDDIMKWSKIAVEAAQQIYTPEQWSEKKSYAISIIKGKLSEKGIALDENSIEAIVESAVMNIKNAK